MLNPLKFISKIFRSTNQKELDRIRKFEELENQTNNTNLGLEKFEVDKFKEN